MVVAAKRKKGRSKGRRPPSNAEKHEEATALANKGRPPLLCLAPYLSGEGPEIGWTRTAEPACETHTMRKQRARAIFAFSLKGTVLHPPPPLFFFLSGSEWRYNEEARSVRGAGAAICTRLFQPPLMTAIFPRKPRDLGGCGIKGSAGSPAGARPTLITGRKTKRTLLPD